MKTKSSRQAYQSRVRLGRLPTLMQKIEDNYNKRISCLEDVYRRIIQFLTKEFSNVVFNGNSLIDFFDQYVSNEVRHKIFAVLTRNSPLPAHGCEAQEDRNRNFLFKVIINTHRATATLCINEIK